MKCRCFLARLQTLLDRQDEKGLLSDTEGHDAEALTELVDTLALRKTRPMVSIPNRVRLGWPRIASSRLLAIHNSQYFPSGGHANFEDHSFNSDASHAPILPATVSPSNIGPPIPQWRQATAAQQTVHSKDENDVAAHSRATLGHASSVYSTLSRQITSKWPPPSTNCTWHGFPNCEESAALPFRS